MRVSPGPRSFSRMTPSALSSAARSEVTLGVRFGVFTLDAPTRQLLSGSRPIHLSPKAFDLLALLVQQRPAQGLLDALP